MITPTTVNYNDSQKTKQGQTSLAFEQETNRAFLYLETRLEKIFYLDLLLKTIWTIQNALICLDQFSRVAHTESHRNNLGKTVQ